MTEKILDKHLGAIADAINGTDFVSPPLEQIADAINGIEFDSPHLEKIADAIDDIRSAIVNPISPHLAALTERIKRAISKKNKMEELTNAVIDEIEKNGEADISELDLQMVLALRATYPTCSRYNSHHDNVSTFRINCGKCEYRIFSKDGLALLHLKTRQTEIKEDDAANERIQANERFEANERSIKRKRTNDSCNE